MCVYIVCVCGWLCVHTCVCGGGGGVHEGHDYVKSPLF